MSLPTSVVITGCDSHADPGAGAACLAGLHAADPGEMAALRARTAAGAEGGLLEGYKTSGRFDGTINNPHWLTTASVTA